MTLARPALGMALGTAASRLTGLGRTVALATALGVGTVSDAYNTANTAPNMLFTLAVGGTITAGLVPMLARLTTPAERDEHSSVVLGTVTVWAVGASIVLALAAPLVMRLLAAGAGGRADRDHLLTLGTTWLRIFAPQVALYAVSATATAILNAQRRLALAAFAPVATNIVVIAACLAFVAVVGTRPAPNEIDTLTVAIIGWGTTIAVLAMAALQLAGARAAAPGLRFRPRLRHPAVRELRHVGLWMLVYVLVNQIGFAVVIALASDVTGGVTAYQWAFALMQLPYAIVAVSIFSAAYPTISAADDAADRSALAHRAAAQATALLVPAAVGLAVLSEPVAGALVGPGERALVAAALRGFSVSLVPFTCFQLLSRTAYASNRSRLPALVNIAANATMVGVDVVVVSVAGSSPHVLTGLALGHAASYLVGCVALDRALRRAAVVGPALRWSAVFGRPALAAAAVAATVLAVDLDGGGSRVDAILTVLVGVAVGAATYAVAAYILGLHRVLRGDQPNTRAHSSATASS